MMTKLNKECISEIKARFSEIKNKFQTADPNGLDAIFDQYLKSVSNEISKRCLKEAEEHSTSENTDMIVKKIVEEYINGFLEYMNNLPHKED